MSMTMTLKLKLQLRTNGEQTGDADPVSLWRTEVQPSAALIMDFLAVLLPGGAATRQPTVE